VHKQKKLQGLDLGQLDRLTLNLNTTGSLDMDLFSLVVLLYTSQPECVLTLLAWQPFSEHANLVLEIWGYHGSW
jgi:hypothetical protein